MVTYQLVTWRYLSHISIMKTIPFKYGKVVKGSNFTNRKNEIALLSSNFTNLINTILISPRRWGKSSLVRKAAAAAIKKDSSIKLCFIDLYKVRTEEEFYELLTLELLAATSGKMSEVASNIKKFFKQFIPKLSYSPVQDSEFTVGLNWEEVKKRPDEILNLAETIATKQKIKLVICIDEFQNLGFFKDSIAFQKRLRANWQNHDHVTYCMYGSKRHMMLEVFTNQSMPFFQFGSLVFLEKISREDWGKYITKQFRSTGKEISLDSAYIIAQKMENHPYYVQQLSHLCWLNTSTKCDVKTIEKAFDQLLMQLSLLFQNLTDTLSNKQINYLKALIDEVPALSSSRTLKEYKLGTSATVNKSKKALIEKEIIDHFDSEIEFIDPAYKGWLKKYYFI